MAKSAGQKLKLLYLEQYLYGQTDEEHGVTLQQIIDHLAGCGVSAERKSIYDDIESLRSYGCEIQRRKDKKWVYYVTDRKFQLAELKLLVDAVQSSRFITRKKSDELIKKLESLASHHQASTLQRQVYVAGRIKTMNESIYYNIDELHAAISAGRQISFLYFDWTVDKKRHYRHDGQRYQVSPYTLVWNDEYYYLVAYDAATDIMRNYRVDRMQDICTEEEKREGAQLFEKHDAAFYSRRVFDMYGGREENVTLRFSARLAGSAMDRFGSDVYLKNTGDGNFDITVKVVTSPRFYGWLFGFGPDAAIVGPENVRKEFADFAKDTLARYEEVENGNQ